MDYVIIGGDARFGWLARLLKQRGDSVGTLFREAVPGVPVLEEVALREARNAVLNYPPKLSGGGMLFEELLALLPGDASVYACGPWHPDADARIVDLWTDEALLADNARLTAEGALAVAMRASDRALRDTRCMVIGWGRVGRALAELLVGMGVRVTVASRSAAKRNRAVERGAESTATNRLRECLPGHGVIFNTSPERVLDASVLEAVDRDALLIDLASLPFGIDLRAAWALGLRAWREPGLPGRCCPQSAAQALLAAMERHAKGGDERD